MEMSEAMSKVLQRVWSRREVVASVKARLATELCYERCTILPPGFTGKKERSPILQDCVLGGGL